MKKRVINTVLGICGQCANNAGNTVGRVMPAALKEKMATKERGARDHVIDGGLDVLNDLLDRNRAIT